MNTHELQNNLLDTPAMRDAIRLMTTTELDLTDFDLDKEFELRKARCATQENFIKLQIKQFNIKRELLILLVQAQQDGHLIDETCFGDFEDTRANFGSHESDPPRLPSVEVLTGLFRPQLISSIDEWSRLTLKLHWLEINRLINQSCTTL